MTESKITPPAELRAKWMTEARSQDYCSITEQVAARAAQWGADQELEACCEWTTANFGELPGQNLHLYRRPKPPSLKKQALEDLESLVSDLANHGMKFKATNIRRALEALPADD